MAKKRKSSGKRSKSSSREKKSGRKYLHKLSHTFASKVESPNRVRRSKEMLNCRSSDQVIQMSLSDSVHQHVDHTYLRQDDAVTSNF